MAALDDLISQIPDESLRERIRAEVKRANRQKKFGLVFEEHLPEATPLYDIPVKRGSVVATKDGQVTDIYYVEKIEDGQAACFHKATKERVVLPVDALVCVAQFGEPIYPYLQPLDTVCNAPDSDLWHTLIEADNYHALQLLEYLYAGKVDCIYIDPPYNTGARDWKYNNDYVDGNDTYRHSKWLSMMEKRLRIAKRLLNPAESVLIVTIDEKEYLHLGCLLEELFPEARIQMVWQRYQDGGESGVKMQCLVTGNEDEIAAVHPSVKGVRDAQSSGAALVSFNAPAFCSYGREQNYNAPVGKYAAFAYTAALNHLLADRDHVQHIGDTTVVCWAEGADDAYPGFFSAVIGGGTYGE